jgi:tRNA pseudouridine65 synthase
MLLHASRLSFTHPVGGERIAVTAPLDAQFRKACALFGWEEGVS